MFQEYILTKHFQRDALHMDCSASSFLLLNSKSSEGCNSFYRVRKRWIFSEAIPTQGWRRKTLVRGSTGGHSSWSTRSWSKRNAGGGNHFQEWWSPGLRSRLGLGWRSCEGVEFVLMRSSWSNSSIGSRQWLSFLCLVEGAASYFSFVFCSSPSPTTGTGHMFSLFFLMMIIELRRNKHF